MVAPVDSGIEQSLTFVHRQNGDSRADRKQDLRAPGTRKGINV
jgi:hypothetical protein